MLIQNGKTSFALGMKWSLHSSLRETKTILKSMGRTPHVQAAVQGLASDGGPESSDAHKQTLIGKYEGPIKGQVYSAALAIGMVEPQCVVLHDLGDGRAVTMLISNGYPVAGRGEQIVAVQEAINQVKEGLAHAGVIIGDADYGGKYTLPEVLDLFEQRVKAKQIPKKAAQGALLQVSMAPATRVAIMTALLAVPALGFLGYQILQSKEAAQLRERLNLQQLAKDRELEARRQSDLNAAKAKFEQDVAARRQELTQIGGLLVQQWQAWERVRHALPFSVAGYGPTTMTCSLAECTIQWAQLGPNVLVSDKRHIPGWVQTNDMGPQATSKVQLTPIVGGPAEPVAIEPAALRLALHEALQALGTPQVDALAPVMVQPPQGVPLPPAIAGSAGKVQINFGGAMAIVNAQEAMQRLQKWPVRLRTVTWAGVRTGSPTINVEGEYMHQASGQ